MKSHFPAAVFLTVALVMVVRLGPLARGESSQASESGMYRSPICVAISPDGKTLYVTDHTAGNVTILDAAGKTKRGEVALRGKPRGVALSADGDMLYVAEHGAGSVAVIDTAKRQVTSRIRVGQWPSGLAMAPNSNRLYVGNQDSHTVSVVDLSQSPAESISEILRDPRAPLPRCHTGRTSRRGGQSAASWSGHRPGVVSGSEHP